jgi:hypothetical protein
MTNPVEIFTIRLWREKLDERQSEWRGRVQHLGSGQARYFNEIGKIADFIAEHLYCSKPSICTAASCCRETTTTGFCWSGSAWRA